MRDSGGAAGRVLAHWWVGSGAVLKRLASGIRRISGMPDYRAYVSHLRSCHPGSPVPSERQFYDDFVRSRYEDGPTRCC
jgi:uncharacterized short protein YbdD (DUF466 family)